MQCRKKDGEVVNINRNRMEGGNIDSIGLKIQKVLRTDIGNYTCELQNDYGIGVSENAIALDVHCEYILGMCFAYSQHSRGGKSARSDFHHMCIAIHVVWRY